MHVQIILFLISPFRSAKHFVINDSWMILSDWHLSLNIIIYSIFPLLLPSTPTILHILLPFYVIIIFNSMWTAHTCMMLVHFTSLFLLHHVVTSLFLFHHVVTSLFPLHHVVWCAYTAQTRTSDPRLTRRCSTYLQVSVVHKKHSRYISVSPFVSSSKLIGVFTFNHFN